MYYSSICLITKDCKHSYLEEWCNWHLGIGFEHIYIFENNSKNKFSTSLKNVTIYDYNIKRAMNPQIRCYQNFIKNFRKKTKWCAFIDDDEFIVPFEEPHNINIILKQYEYFPALSINWLMFGSSGYSKDDNESLIKKFTRRCKFVNMHVKLIIKISEATKWITPHHCIYRNKKLAVDEDKNKVINSFNKKKECKKISINHYHTKTIEEWKSKIIRGRPNSRINRNLNTWFELDKIYSEVEDNRIIQIYNKLFLK